MGLVSTLAHPDCQRSGTLQGSALAVEPRWYVPPSCSHDATGIIFFFFFFFSLGIILCKTRAGIRKPRYVRGTLTRDLNSSP